MRVQRSIEIAAPPAKIWPFLVEPEKVLKWCITLEKFELPYGFIGKILGLFARRRSEAIVGEMLAKLKSLAEA